MRKKISLLILILSSCLSIQGQSFLTTKTINESLKKQFNKAYALFEQQAYEYALVDLNKITKKEPRFINALMVSADCHINLRQYNLAVEKLKKVVELAPEYDGGVYYTLGGIAMEQEQYNEARVYLEKYLTFPTKNENRVLRAKKMVEDAKFRPEALRYPVPFEPKNMGSSINSPHREYFPSVTADENTMVFTRQFGTGQSAQEDLYRSLKKNGEWTIAEPLPHVNTNENEAAQSISADGKFLVFTVCNRPGDYGSCDLYYSERIEGRWTTPKNMGAEINSEGWESQPSIGPNGNILYFTRGGSRGQGNKNLMYSVKQTNGLWSKPQPLSELNTAYDDSGPCIHPDGKTLYFASSGHPGMGGLDLFVSRKQSNGIWSKPVNLGYPINSSKNEEALAVSLSGDLAFIASDREGGYGSLDIYSFQMPSSVKPLKATYVKGIVFDAVTKDVLPNTSVELYDLSISQMAVNTVTDSDGEFLLCLPANTEYSLHTNRAEYLFYSDHFELSDSNNFLKPFVKEIPLYRSKNKTNSKDSPVTEPIILKNVFFSTNSAELLPKSEPELNLLLEMLQQNTQLIICINGHTDNVGTVEKNLILSEKRAESVKNYLISKGVSPDRLESKGYGETKPISTNQTEEGRQLNRRTEFFILSS